MVSLEVVSTKLKGEIQRNSPSQKVCVKSSGKSNTFSVITSNFPNGAYLTITFTEIGGNLTVKSSITLKGKVSSSRYKSRSIKTSNIGEKTTLEIGSQSAGVMSLSEEQVAMAGWNLFQQAYGVLSAGAF